MMARSVIHHAVSHRKTGKFSIEYLTACKICMFNSYKRNKMHVCGHSEIFDSHVSTNLPTFVKTHFAHGALRRVAQWPWIELQHSN